MNGHGTEHGAKVRRVEGPFITFGLGEDRYGFAINNVKHIVGLFDTAIDPVRADKPYVRGLAEHRGRPTPVIDLRLRLDLPETEYDRWACIIIVASMLPSGIVTQVGFVVDRIGDLADFELVETDVAERDVGVDSSYILGTSTSRGRTTILLDADRLVAEEDIDYFELAA